MIQSVSEQERGGAGGDDIKAIEAVKVRDQSSDLSAGESISGKSLSNFLSADTPVRPHLTG